MTGGEYEKKRAPRILSTTAPHPLHVLPTSSSVLPPPPSPRPPRILPSSFLRCSPGPPTPPRRCLRAISRGQTRFEGLGRVSALGPPPELLPSKPSCCCYPLPPLCGPGSAKVRQHGAAVLGQGHVSVLAQGGMWGGMPVGERAGRGGVLARKYQSASPLSLVCFGIVLSCCGLPPTVF